MNAIAVEVVTGTEPLAEGRAPYTFGLTPSELIKQVTKELDGARSAIDAADSLNAVAGLALRQQGCDADYAVADVLEDHVYPQLSAARDAVVTADELLARLRDIAEAIQREEKESIVS
jgi:hypothetical protein